ncbi:MAG: type II 3-dehydroquinate dehydratase [Chloroflexota bacterium]|nr:type II 3-dehydroquinate dehydratase [Chloroflexota bacterium]MDE2688024.1 type II 3-dehydroquinate dehydratase [Chloroflexota bacterium]
MTKVLVLHGQGMELRGKVDIEIFGTMTLPEYDENIRQYAADLGVDVEIFHSNEESEVIAKLKDSDADAALINPGGYTTGHPALADTIREGSTPTLEIHMSNPASRGRISEIGPACRGVITGIGIMGYNLGLQAAKELSAQ